MNGQTISITQEERKLKTFIRQYVKEAFASEVIKLKAALLPYVSDKEQKDIEQLYGRPSRKATKSFNFEI